MAKVVSKADDSPSRVKEEPMWGGGVQMPVFPALEGSRSVDVAVIGAGITGLTTAYLLSQAGLKVALIERDRIVQGATRYTTAFLTQSIDTNIADLITMFGIEKTKVIVASHADAITAVERIVRDENITCQFMRCSNYIFATSAQDQSWLEREQLAAAQVGLTMFLKDKRAFPFRNFGHLELPGQAKFDPVQYLAGMVSALTTRGVQIYEETEATELVPGQPVTVVATDGTVSANHVVVATHAPFNKKLFFKKAFYKTYVLAARLPHGTLPEGIYEDTAIPYHYVRIDRLHDHDRMIVGGADHRADIPVNTEKSYQALTDWARATFANIPFEITRRWDGQLVEPVDGLASIGAVDEENVFYATGFSGNGMTYSMIAAQSIADRIQGKHNAWASVYDARRRSTLKQLLYKGRDYTKVLLGGAIKTTFR